MKRPPRMYVDAHSSCDLYHKMMVLLSGILETFLTPMTNAQTFG